MKNPKWKCAYPNSHKVKFGGKFLTQWDGYHLTLEQSTGGTISADKLKGYQEQSANLSYTANQDYYFNGWQSTGANIQNNQVPFTQDTTARAKFNSMNASGGATAQYNVAGSRNFHYIKQGNYTVGTFDYNSLDTDLHVSLSANSVSNRPIIATKTKINYVPCEGDNKYYFIYETYASGNHYVYHWGDINAWETDQSNPTWDFDVSENTRVQSNVLNDKIPILCTMDTDDFYNVSGSVDNFTLCVPHNWSDGYINISYVTHTFTATTAASESHCTRLSAYYNGNFVASAKVGVRGDFFTKFGVNAGVYSGANNVVSNYYVNSAVPGSCYLGWRGFSSENDAKLWATN